MQPAIIPAPTPPCASSFSPLCVFICELSGCCRIGQIIKLVAFDEPWVGVIREQPPPLEEEYVFSPLPFILIQCALSGLPVGENG